MQQLKQDEKQASLTIHSFCIDGFYLNASDFIAT